MARFTRGAEETSWVFVSKVVAAKIWPVTSNGPSQAIATNRLASILHGRN